MIFPLYTYDISLFVNCNPHIPFRLGIAFSTLSIISLQTISSKLYGTILLLHSICNPLYLRWKPFPLVLLWISLSPTTIILISLGSTSLAYTLWAIEHMGTSTMSDYRAYKIQKSWDRERYLPNCVECTVGHVVVNVYCLHVWTHPSRKCTKWSLYWTTLMEEAPFMDPSCPI